MGKTHSEDHLTRKDWEWCIHFQFIITSYLKKNGFSKQQHTSKNLPIIPCSHKHFKQEKVVKFLYSVLIVGVHVHLLTTQILIHCYCCIFHRWSHYSSKCCRIFNPQEVVVAPHNLSLKKPQMDGEGCILTLKECQSDVFCNPKSHKPNFSHLDAQN